MKKDYIQYFLLLSMTGLFSLFYSGYKGFGFEQTIKSLLVSVFAISIAQLFPMYIIALCEKPKNRNHAK